jgi:hypothetical protein
LTLALSRAQRDRLFTGLDAGGRLGNPEQDGPVLVAHDSAGVTAAAV